MRGAGDDMSIGERIAFYRVRRGLTQAVLAGLVGRTDDWLSKIERGERPVRRLDVLVELARELRVGLGDLVGQPVLVDAAQPNEDDVPAIRDALMSPARLSHVLFAQQLTERHIDPGQIAVLVESAWANYQDGHLGKAIAILPELIRTAQTVERDDTTGRTRWAVSARVHHLAATVLSKLGESDLAWIAAERAMGAADMSENPLVLGSAARAGTHALLSVGRYGDALTLGGQARGWLEQHVDDGPEALSLLGMLDLRMATAAARRQDRLTASSLLGRAEEAASRLGRDANHWQTAFGPTNVMLHRLSAALDLGDMTWVVEHGPRIDPSQVPIERRACHWVVLARAYSALARDDDAVNTLLSAEEQAPQLVRHHPMVRETIRAIHRRAPKTMTNRQTVVLHLAERCRAVA